VAGGTKPLERVFQSDNGEWPNTFLKEGVNERAATGLVLMLGGILQPLFMNAGNGKTFRLLPVPDSDSLKAGHQTI
jgi:hypothetical protein